MKEKETPKPVLPEVPQTIESPNVIEGDPIPQDPKHPKPKN